MEDLELRTARTEEIIDETSSPLHMGLHEHDLSEGGEYLGDGIRMHDQPLGTRKENKD